MENKTQSHHERLQDRKKSYQYFVVIIGRSPPSLEQREILDTGKEHLGLIHLNVYLKKYSHAVRCKED